MEIIRNIHFVGTKQPTDLFTEVDPWCTQATVEECIEYIKDKKVLGLDIETTWAYNGVYNTKFVQKFGKEKNSNAEGLDPRLSKIVMIQIGDLERQYIIDARSVCVDTLLPYLEDSSIIKVGQNLKFEYKHFKMLECTIDNMYDTMVAEKVLYTGKLLDWSLKGLIARYTGNTVDKGTRLEFAHIGEKAFSRKQVEYGADDIIYPLKIRESQLMDAKSKQVEKCISLEMKFLPVLGDIEFNGMHFNQEVWMKTYRENMAALEPTERALSEYVLDNFQSTKYVDRQYDMFQEGFTCNISWSSPAQVKEFFKSLGITPMEKGKMSLNAKVLKGYLPQIKDEKLLWLAKKFLDYAKLKQSTTTFGEKFLKYVHPITGRLHSNYNQVLMTGRISSSSPNLQNIPATHGHRSAFDCPEGWNIVNADYSGQEQIILANKSQDPELQQFYVDGHSDMHSFIASKIYPELRGLSLEEIKRDHAGKRQIAKAAGFAINYGGTGYTIAKNLGISEDEGDAVYDAYFAAFPNLKKYFDQVQRESLRRGYILIDPVTSRKNWFRPPETNKERGAIKKIALNYPIQGEAGGITKLAPILFRDWIKENSLEEKVLITNLVHDEINIEVLAIHAEEAARALENCMKQSADIWCKTIKLSADAVITNYWNH
jgi:DNA polymerase I